MVWSSCGVFVVGNPWVLAFEEQEERGKELPYTIGGFERSAGVVSTASSRSLKVHHCGWPDVLWSALRELSVGPLSCYGKGSCNSSTLWS